ncbi:hypothetical protein BDV40DRAFT_215927 [Aspergillus tamarii]|uniref:Transmembrane protein n=1 Tax=Aspergillus tamarii TaxID=41984 RepID=A0A5N6UP79_ASPTM|nr:hypothetical protein BDV40DRAFT_215927 [Aspergillus tamarii]
MRGRGEEEGKDERVQGTECEGKRGNFYNRECGASVPELCIASVFSMLFSFRVRVFSVNVMYFPTFLLGFGGVRYSSRLGDQGCVLVFPQVLIRLLLLGGSHIKFMLSFFWWESRFYFFFFFFARFRQVFLAKYRREERKISA